MGRQAGCLVLVGVAAAILAGRAGAATPPSIVSELNRGTSVRCEGTQPRTIITSGQNCTVVQPAGGTAWCIQRIKKHRAVPVTQHCEIRQAGAWRENIAYVVQVIEVKGKASPQDATQIADIRQGNEFADNRASVTQVTKLSLNRKGKGRDDNGENGTARGVAAQEVEQTQEARQSVIVCQGAAGALGPVDPTNCRSGSGMRADNGATVAQTQSESERASKAARIVQEQNTASRPNACSPSDVSDPVVPDDDANACANVDQSTQLSPPAAGDNRSQLSQLYIQSQEASRAEWTAQCQGFPAAPCFLSGSPEVGGLDYTINQSGPDPSTIATEQRSLQVQRVDGIATFIRKQDPRISKGAGSTQGTHPNNRWSGSQIATQLQFEDGRLRGDSQSALLEYFGSTSGKIRATQAINQNGRKAKNSCSGSVCAAVLECTTAPPESQARVRRNSAVSHPQTCTAPGPGDDDDDDDD
jgi:hypothetical protein